MDEDTSGIEFGDLPEILEQVAREHGATDEDLPLHGEYGGFCDHSRANLNAPMRKLTCRKCGAQLDPFDFLARLTRDTDRWVHARKSCEKRAHEVAGRLEGLLRDERNARARLARLKRREADG